MELVEQVKILIKETDGYEDALNYVEEVAEDCNVSVEAVIAELRKQLDKEEN